MIHGSNESLSKLEFKNGLISFFEKNKIVEVVRVTNEQLPLYFLRSIHIKSSYAETELSHVCSAGVSFRREAP